MGILFGLEGYTVKLIVFILASISTLATAINILSMGIPASAYPVIEKDYPRFANFLRASRATGGHLRKALPALLGVLTGKPWQPGALVRAVAKIEGDPELPPTTPPPAPETAPDTLENVVSKLREFARSNPDLAPIMLALDTVLEKPAPKTNA